MHKLRQLIGLILEAEATAPVAGGVRFSDPKRARREKMDQLIREVADALDLTGLRFLASSTRILGAYTYAAIDADFNNVVVKIQPASELEGYKQAQMIISRLPSSVASHLPRIYKVRTLEEIGVNPPVDDLGRSEQLGVVIMERLEELQGDLFELITQPASKSQRSLEVLLGEPDAFNDLITDTLRKSDKMLRRMIASSPDPADADGKIQALHEYLVSMTDDPDEILTADERIVISPLDGLRRVASQKIADWCNEVGISNRGNAQTLVMTLTNDMIGILSRRAIPKEPMTQKPGALGGIRGVKGLKNAIEYMKSAGIAPDDVHGNNIMIRPETGELVISDLGHF